MRSRNDSFSKTNEVTEHGCFERTKRKGTEETASETLVKNEDRNEKVNDEGKKRSRVRVCGVKMKNKKELTTDRPW